MLIVLAPSIINIKVHFCGMLVLYNEGAVLMEHGKQEGPSSLGALVSNSQRVGDTTYYYRVAGSIVKF